MESDGKGNRRSRHIGGGGGGGGNGHDSNHRHHHQVVACSTRNKSNNQAIPAKVSLTANYSPGDQRYSSSSTSINDSIDDRQRAQSGKPATATVATSTSSSRPRRRRRRGSGFGALRDCLDYALSFKKEFLQKTENHYLLGAFVGLNILVAVLNTILLSLLVKSIQLNGGGVGGGGHGSNVNQELLLFASKLSLSAHGEHTVVLDAPLSLAQNKTLSAGRIESHGLDSPLVIAGGSGSQHADKTSQLTNESQDFPGDGSSGGESKGSIRSERQKISRKVGRDAILISTGEQAGASYILIDDNKPVEFVTDALLIDKLEGGGGGSGGGEGSGGVARPKDESKSLPRDKVAARQRLVELNARRQSVDLPQLDKLELYPAAASAASASALIVNDVLTCDAGISGLLGANLDIQTRTGNLSCRSSRALGLVSRSGKLNLAPTRALQLDAPTLKMSAPSTKQLFMSGIKFVNLEQQQQQQQKQAQATVKKELEQHKENLPSLAKQEEKGKEDGRGDEQLRQLKKLPAVVKEQKQQQQPQKQQHQHGELHSYNLVLVDGALMAVAD